jgi:antitoxin MazE
MRSFSAIPFLAIRMRTSCAFPNGGTASLCACPKTLVDEMGLRAGDDVTLVRAADRTISIDKDQRRQQALDGLTDMRIPLPPDCKFDRDDANER